MSRALEPALLSLLPTYTELPQPLLELASSLLAQSRHSAGTLKAEEEVARSYACCHIACERQKMTLNLPPIQPRPPVPPRIYKRLYIHLDNILPAGAGGKSSRTRTPTSKARDSTIFGTGGQRTPSRATPSKDSSLSQFRSPAAKNQETPTKSARKPPPLAAKRKAGGPDSALAPWIKPTAQMLCRDLGEERLYRTIMAGMHTIVVPHGRPTKDKWVMAHLTPLLAAVYLTVSAQLFVFEKGKDMGQRDYVKTRKAILQTLDRAQREVAVKEMDEDELWIGWDDVTAPDVDKALEKIVNSDWQQEEWFTGIENLVRTDRQQEAGAGRDTDIKMGDGGDENGDEFSGRLHLHKADTMLQSRWVITDRKRQEYQAWEQEMLRRIEHGESTQGQKMDVS